MQLGISLNKLISALSFSAEVWLSLLLGAFVTIVIAYVIYRIQKKEADIHLQKHDSRFDELKQLHQQDSEKIRVLYELIIQSQRGSVGEIEAADLEQKIEIAAEQITDKDSDHAQALKAIAEKDKDEADDLLDKIAQREHDLVEVYKLRAMNENRNGFYAEAVKWYRKIVELEPDDFMAQNELVWTMLRADMDLEAREIALTKLAALDKEESADVEQILSLLHVIISSYNAETESEQIEPYIIRAAELTKQKFGEQSEEMVQLYTSLGILCKSKQQYKECEDYFQKVLAIHVTAGEEQGPSYAIALHNLAILYFDLSRFQEALPLFDKSMEVIVAFAGDDNPRLIYPILGRAGIYVNTGRFSEAEADYLKARSIAEKKLGIGHDAYYEVMSDFATLYLHMQKLDEAEVIYNELLEQQTAKHGSADYRIASLSVKLAEVLLHQRRFEEAEPVLHKAIEIYRKIIPPEHPMMLRSLNSLAYLDSEKGNYEEARQGYLDIISITKKKGKEDSLDLHVCEANLAGLYVKMELWSEAEPLLRKVIAFFEANEIKTPFYTRILQRYADVLTKLGRQSEADSYKAKAEKLKAKLDGQSTEQTEKIENT